MNHRLGSSSIVLKIVAFVIAAILALALLALSPGLGHADNWGYSYVPIKKHVPHCKKVSYKHQYCKPKHPHFKKKFPICHKNKKTLWLPKPAHRGHVGHGDTPGKCVR